MHAKLGHPGGKLHHVSSVGHGFEHGQNVRAATVATEARDVLFNGSKIYPEAALGDSAGEIAHRFHHAGFARTFEEHGIART